MSKSHTDTIIFSNANDEDCDDENAIIDWKTLHDIEHTKNINLGFTIINIKSGIKEHVCYDVNDMVLKLRSKTIDLKQVILASVGEFNTLECELINEAKN